MSEHPVGIGLASGEELEGLCGLVDGHSTAVQGAATECSCLDQQFRVEGSVDHVGDPKSWMQQFRGEWQPWVVGHARGGDMHESVGSHEQGAQHVWGRCGDSVRAETGREFGGQR